MNLSNPLEDDSRWTLTGSRFAVDWEAYDALGAMIGELMEQLAPDDPTRLLWNVLSADIAACRDPEGGGFGRQWRS